MFRTLSHFTVTPDSQKSTTDKISENVSGAGDRVAGAVQPGQYFDLLFALYTY